jgi:spermidine synthase
MPAAPLSGRLRAALFAIFTVTGFSALTLQVTWQRIMSLHSGVDLVSFTTVIAAFLAGLGVGSLVGGVLADRLGPRRSLLAFAIANVGVAVIAWTSVWLFYDLYRDRAHGLQSTATTFGFNFLLVIVPATMMGLSLPLVARGVVERVQDAGSLVGRLYAVNTIGAAAGAAVTGWYLAGTFGFSASLRIAGTLNLLAAVIVLSLWRLAERVNVEYERVGTRTERAPSAPSGAPGARSRDVGASHVWPWFAIYALTGAVALGFELVFFRVIDGVMRSNSYSFPYVLSLYLLLFGVGSALGARFVRRAERAARWFLALQSCAGLAAIVGIILLVVVAPRVGLEETLRSYLGTDGFNTGFDNIDSASEWAKLGFAYVLVPLLVMGVPVLLFGASYPFVQALVSERVDTLGRRTGTLLAANIAGNVAGTLVVGFVLIDVVGTAGTMLVLALVLLVPGLAAAYTSPTARHRAVLAGGVVVAFGLATLAFPSNAELWAFVHGVDPDEHFELLEDRSCVTALKQDGAADDYRAFLFVNGASQNGYPWDDFHVLVGLTPALMHPSPQRGMAVGLGMGGTAYGMVQDRRLDLVHAVEICGGETELLRRAAARGTMEFRRMFAEPRLHLHVADGRKFLLLSPSDLDVVTVDVLRPTSAFSGAIHSVEFFDLVRSRLHRKGLVAQWIATPRSGNSVTTAFPYAIGFPVPSYGSEFFIASSSPIRWDRDEVLARLERVVRDGVFRPEQVEALRDYYETVEPFCMVDGVRTRVESDLVNNDLAPRDEYFLNNGEVPRAFGCRGQQGSAAQ